MAVENNTTAQMNLKFKITTKGIRIAEEKACRNPGKIMLNNGLRDRVTGDGNKRSPVDVERKPSMTTLSSKRRAEMSADDQNTKRRKIDCTFKLLCETVLKELINHPNGWIFSEPVDPVKLRIPDYFSIISRPMDLGTIKWKLAANMYSAAEQFAADVRLTFSNAMLYNPPGHEVHYLAKKLDGEFSRRWKLLEAKLKHGTKTSVEKASSVDRMEKDVKDIKPAVKRSSVDRMVKDVKDIKPAVKRSSVDCMEKDIKPAVKRSQPIGLDKAAPPVVKQGTLKPMSPEEKQKLRLELHKVLSRSVTLSMRTALKKFGLSVVDKERLAAYINSTDDATLRKLRREINVLLNARDQKVEPARTAQNRCPSVRKTVTKEHCTQSARASCNIRESVGSAKAPTSDLSSEISTEPVHSGDSIPMHQDCEVKCSSAFGTNSFGQDTDGPALVRNGENRNSLSTPASTCTFVEGQLSPKKALRAAMLKSRYADTIFKATHELPSQSQVDKSNFSRMMQEREKLKMEQLKEKARIEAEIKSCARREQEDRKMRRERERAALEQMKQTVVICESADILKDVELLYYASLSSPLEQFGLYMKCNYLEEDEDDSCLDAEEGEIL